MYAVLVNIVDLEIVNEVVLPARVSLLLGYIICEV